MWCLLQSKESAGKYTLANPFTLTHLWFGLNIAHFCPGSYGSSFWIKLNSSYHISCNIFLSPLGNYYRNAVHNFMARIACGSNINFMSIMNFLTLSMLMVKSSFHSSRHRICRNLNSLSGLLVISEENGPQMKLNSLILQLQTIIVT